MLKKLRFFVWLTQAFIQRHSQTLIVATLSAFFFVLFGWRYSNFIQTLIFQDRQIIGMVGLYTPTTLPLFIQDKISVGLTRQSDDGRALPAAASAWEIQNGGKTFLFKIRTDLLWHDGKSLKASDINYNFRDAKITPLNSKLLKINLKQPFAPLPSLFSKPLFREGLVGLGPFRVTRLKRQGRYIQELKLDPLDPYLAAPKIIKFYPTLAQAVTAFKLGQITILRTMEKPAALANWEKYLTIKKETSPMRYLTILFKTNKPPFDQKLFRQALAYSISNTDTKGGISSSIPENSWAYNKTLKKIRFNEEKALELFEKSGVATTSAKFTINTFPNLLETANAIRKSWKKTLKIKTAIKVVNTVPDNFSVLLTIQEVPRDPDQYPLWHSTQKTTNLTAYANPKIDKLLEDGRKTFDLKKRKAIYDEFQKYLIDDLPALFLYHPTIYTIARK